jgi:hypothetical protein
MAAKKRAKRYEDSEGNYLTLIEGSRGFNLAWFIPEIDDIGAVVGEDDRDLSWEENAIRKAIKSLADDEFSFSNSARAKKALALANEALWLAASGQTWPEWALTAKAQGWTPPDGWTPK